MVSFQKIVIAGAQEDHLAGMTRHIIADVILMDTTHRDQGNPMLYQLKESEFSHERFDLPVNKLTRLDEDLFVMVGHFAVHDPENKQITLANGDLVTYTHLITIGGSREVDEFGSAYLALLESIRVQRSVQPRPLLVASDPQVQGHHRVQLQNTSLDYSSVLAKSLQGQGSGRDAVVSPTVCNIKLSRQL